MNNQQKQLRQLVDSIYEKTDMMLNAMAVDAFDVFETNLAFRSSLLDQLSNLRAGMSEAEIAELKLESLWQQISDMDKALTLELNRFSHQIQEELSQVTKEKNQITRNRKKANQYQMITDSNLSGGIFDKKK